MYTSANKIIFFLVVSIAAPRWALDTIAEENICAEIGFKKKTEQFANCVLELVNRKSNKVVATTPTTLPSNPDDAACQQKGLKPGTNDYSQCRLQINNAKLQAAQQKAQYEAQQRESQEKSDNSALYLDLLNKGLCIMSGSSPYALQNIGNCR